MERIKQNFNFFLTLLIFCPALFSSKVLDNDFYFLYNHGKYILTNGFPTTEPFSMHDGLDFIVQQWMSSVIFYFTYENFGKLALIILVIIVEIITTAILCKTLFLICENKTLSKILTLPNSLIMLMFSTQRPMIFSYLFIVVLLYFTIKYTKTNNWKYLIVLPLISILQINFHCSMWWFLFIVLLPFFAEIKIFNIHNLYVEDYNKIPLLITILLMFICGFINPYCDKSVFYLFNSISSYDIEIFEMSTPALNNPSGQILILVFIIMFLLVYHIHEKVNVRYMFFFFGSIILVFYAARNLPFLGLSISLLLTDLLKKIDITTILNKVFGYYEFYVPLITVAILIVFVSKLNCILEKDVPMVNDAIVYIKENYDTENATVYAGFNDGGYFEFCGFKSYLDPRMEVYLEKQNHKKDYIEEYYNLQYNELDYKEFINEYEFDYIVVTSNDVLYDKITIEDGYDLIYEDDNYRTFRNIN